MMNHRDGLHSKLLETMSDCRYQNYKYLVALKDEIEDEYYDEEDDGQGSEEGSESENEEAEQEGDEKEEEQKLSPDEIAAQK